MMRARIPGQCVIAAAVAACAVSAVPAYAEKTETVLYSFCHSSGCPDGQYPDSPMVHDAAGNLYGTTLYGGNSNNAGTIYELQKVENGWAFHSLYNFCSQSNCTDGNWPVGGLIVDSFGNLYGTTGLGGNADDGVVYELQTNGTFKVLYSFCAQSECTDGSNPFAGLAYQGQQSGQLYDGVSTLYGTTAGGGPMNWGVVYTIAPGEAEFLMYSFGADNNTNDGQSPAAPLITDGAGNLYGTTSGGGSTGDGTIFSIGTSGSETLLFAFCSQEPEDCGSHPGAGALLMKPDGTLLGATAETGDLAKGVIYSLAVGTYSTLANFCPRPNRPCKAGAEPNSGLIEGASGNLYGTAAGGGWSEKGTAFELAGSKLKAIYTFCALPNCTDGAYPDSRLLMNKRALFGTTEEGGAFNGGTIFELY
jgi:uncharacterized repeat protein (TIGR03803 family)